MRLIVEVLPKRIKKTDNLFVIKNITDLKARTFLLSKRNNEKKKSLILPYGIQNNRVNDESVKFN